MRDAPFTSHGTSSHLMTTDDKTFQVTVKRFNLRFNLPIIQPKPPVMSCFPCSITKQDAVDQFHRYKYLPQQAKPSPSTVMQGTSESIQVPHRVTVCCLGSSQALPQKHESITNATTS